jgi:sulfur-carrier protein adenylyltransferase/sulfurtransferase
MIKELDSKMLEQFMQEKNEKDYILVDVRQPEEYKLDHIPGATHIPLPKIKFDPFVFEDDREIVFYCKSGVRSRSAAMFVAEEAGIKEEKLYNLQGGMMAYKGEILLDYPRIDHFPSDMSVSETMHKSIDFEKGAHLFYTLAAEVFEGTKLYTLMSDLSQAETAHAKFIYNELKSTIGVDKNFKDLFEGCRGQILEGGKSLDTIKEFIFQSKKEECIDVMDFAIEVEYTAYDLYRTMAENSEPKAVRELFFTLSQAEKKHLRKIISNLSLCTAE